MRLLMIAGIALFCAALNAQGYMALRVGDIATDISAENWLDLPEQTSIGEFEGDVVVLVAWGMDSRPAVRVVKDLATILAEKGDKGLHVFGLYNELQPLPELRKFVADNGVGFPQALDFDGGAYESKSLPRVWVIGRDSKVKFIGPKGYAGIIDEELKAVKYPGLGVFKLNAALAPAASALARRDYSEAWKLAKAEAEKEGQAEGVVNDADKVMKRVKQRLTLLKNRAETSVIQGDYRVAIKAYEELEARFKGVIEGAEEAHRELEKLRSDKKVQPEIDAQDAMIEIGRRLTRKASPNEVWIKELQQFIIDHPGTRAAADAATDIKMLQEEAKED
ncbi:MAG: redoxin domain-containing protein [Planctomycetes bacterium]|nr:redoxin domain-containing protein [Planctomycetota bacterium]